MSLHQHYHTVRQLSAALTEQLQDAVLHDAYTLSKDELVLLFEKSNKNLCMKMVLASRHCFLLFSHDNPRKPSNAQPLFQQLVEQRLKKVKQHHNNRSFELQFEHSCVLLFKLYDGLANVLLYADSNLPVEVFRESIKNDRLLALNDFDRSITERAELLKNISIVEGYFCIAPQQDAHLPFAFYLQPVSDKVYESDEILDALTQFARLNLAQLHFNAQKQTLLYNLKAQIRRTESLIHNTNLLLQPDEQTLSADQIGHLIMANLNTIKQGMQEVTLYDLYHGKDIVIKLKKDLSPQDNAAHYYRKQRNIKSETATRHDTLMRAQAKLEHLQSNYEQVIKASQASDLKPFMKQQREKEKSLPFKVYEKNGYTIWVGKNASSNDVLTTQYAQKNDMWLHAKDVSGSHVVIKQQGAHFPNDVIHYAAQLAAYYSKLKGSSLVPVCYTLKKYVRKPKGMEPGQVVVDREEVMLVEPYIHDK